MSLPDVTAAGRHQLRRVDLAADRQVDRDLRRDPRDRPDRAAGRAQAARPLPGTATDRTGSAPTACCSRWPTSVKLLTKESLPPRRRGPVPVRDRAGADHHQRPSRRSRSSRSATSRTGSACTASTCRSGSSTSSPSARSSFYGLLLGGWASRLQVQLPGRDALRRAADLLRDLDGPGAARRDHDGRLALAGRHRQRPGRHVWYIVPPVRRLPDLHDRRLRRDQPPAVRPAGGRRRARRRLQHRVRRDALRLLLHGRVHGDDRDLRDRLGDVPRRLARALGIHTPARSGSS